jgi:tryptophanyl-tRNA synthetase
VGEDQKQHIELTRDVAIRFNNRYGDTFVVPEPLIQEVGARIMSLDDPSVKMSKSNPNEFSKISILDSPDRIKKAIMRSTTDSESEVRYDLIQKPGISNLMSIYSLLEGSSMKDLEKRYAGQGYGQFKKDLVEVVNNHLQPIRERYKEVLSSGEIMNILKDGAHQADITANKVLDRVKDKVGFVRF